jgi:hypothetical protein
MGRPPIEKEDIKISFGALAKRKVVELIGRKKCKEIAEIAINKEYKKLSK